MKRIFVTVLLVCLCASSAFARDIVLAKGGREAAAIDVVSESIMKSGDLDLILNFRVSRLTASVVETPMGEYTLLSIPGFQASAHIGAPSLPVMNRLIEVPFGAELKVDVIDYTSKEYTFDELGIKHALVPHQPSHPKCDVEIPFKYELSAYINEGFRQDELAAIEEVGIMRHIRMAMVKVSPVAYNPREKTVRVFNNIKIQVSMQNADLGLTQRVRNQYSSPYFSWVDDKVLRPSALKSIKAIQECGIVGYLIIADRMFEQDLQSFIQWKFEKGFHVKVAYTDEIGKKADQIKSFIHGLYKNPTAEFPVPSFVLFVGDNDQIPAFKGTTGGHITDLNFVDVTNDNIPDILSGRFSARNVSELIPQIEKTLMYEKYEFPDPSFLNDVVLVAGWDWSHADEWGWPQINYGTKYYFNAEHGYNNISVYLSSGSHQNESSIRTDVAAGCSFLNYTAHGSSTSWADPGFRISHINSLGNFGKYPLVIGNCCLTSKFEVGTCFGEAWLRAKDQGAIGYIGGTNSTYWDEDLWWGNGNYPIVHPNSEGTPPLSEETGPGAYDGAFQGNFKTQAGFMLAGNLAVEESSSSRKKYYWEVYELMGDPALMVYWGEAKKNAVVHPMTLEAESTSLVIEAAAGSLAAVSMNGELLGTSLIGNNGKAAIDFNEAAPAGELKIVVTGQNLQPYIGTITIGQ
ncbi:MAG: C25 family cysteine peptidase [bacterium]|jgi:hypothetical protein|nr:C25 family cysteine peptidase [bacterium]